MLGAVIILSIGYILAATMGRDESRESVHQHALQDSNQVIHLVGIPSVLTFAGEEMLLNEPDLVERFDREMIVNTHFHSNTILLLKRANRWFPQIEPILDDFGVPGDFIYLPLIESGLSNARSPKGAVGFWQLLPETARELGLEVNTEVDERYDPIKSTYAACQYLLKAKEKFGTWTNAAASYNMGMRGLARSMENQKVEHYRDLLLNEETSRYIFRIVSMKMIYENPDTYGFAMPEEALYARESLKEIIIKESQGNLADFAFSNGINYKILKRYNPWLRTNTLTIRQPGKEYKVLIPTEYNETVKLKTQISDSSMIGSDRYMDDEK